MPPLRILHVAPYSERAWAYGGIPRVLASLAHAQARGGHRVTIATTDVRDATSRLAPPGAARPPRLRLRSWNERLDDGIEAFVFPNLSNRIANRWQFYQPLGLGGFLRRHAGDFDVAHLHACHNLATALAARVLAGAGVPYVVQPNGTARRIERRRAAKWLFDSLFARRLLEGAAAVIAVSEWERRQLEAGLVAPDRCHLVPNPLAPAPEPLPGGAAFRRRLGLSADPLILFLGVLSPRKHPEVLVEAASSLRRPVQLLFAGADGGALAATRQAAERLGLLDRVRFAGVLEGAARFAALASADVAVYASHDEAFGLSALEALQAGTPVVVGDDAGCAEVIASVEGGLLATPGDASALAVALDRMLARLPVWKAVARQAGAIASKRFHPDAVWSSLEPVYRSVSAEPGVLALATSVPAPVEDPAPAAAEVPAPGDIEVPAPVAVEVPAAVPEPERAETPVRPHSGVTFIVAVHNGERWLEQVLEAIDAQRDGRPFEVVAVDDGSTDSSPAVLEKWSQRKGIRVIRLEDGGHPAAVNAGVRAASHPIVCLVDQDVVLQPGWLQAIGAALDEPGVAAVQGTFAIEQGASLVARVMGLDLGQRYTAMAGPATSHVCTGNSAYRVDALRQVGLFFDESFGYGADNDMSYRLAGAGYELRFCAEAKAVHHWRESLWSYLRQQYGFGYGRLDLVAKHPRRAGGDSVSPAAMMAHGPLMLAALGLALVWLASLAWGRMVALAGWLALVIVAGLAIERLAAGIRAASRHKDAAGLWFAPFHIARDVAWAFAIVAWAFRRLLGRTPRPEHSMRR
ncbi:MAG TPA: glycosyltransferase [Vicinamibacterales bacterium]|nr:glycosyltransferase [Vicinamibacterales bacterium]